jgi:3-methyladenine DNA glycosylase AlkD
MVAALAAEILEQVQAAPDRTVATLRRLRRAMTRRARTLAPAQVVRLARTLLADPVVPRWLVYELVHHHRPAMACMTPADIDRLGHGMTSWGDVDTFACYLSGPAWRQGRLPDAVVHRWAVSTDRWWRRAAVVSTVPLNNTARGGSGDAARTLALCAIVKDDRDDMVVKALSWALRELARNDAAAVRAFLQRNEDRLAARVLREVRNKLETGLKNPRSAAKTPRRG